MQVILPPLLGRLCVIVSKRSNRRRGALNKQRGVDICNFRHTLVSNSHRAHSPDKIIEVG